MNIKYIIPLLFLVTSVHVFADILPRHGFIDSPPSRAFLCSSSGGYLNKDCGPVMYEPQSVEGPKGFPETGPADGNIASGGNADFSELNVQSPERWYKNPMSSGLNIFSWKLTTPHSTASWRFFITKQYWDPKMPLTRADFDLTPFCEKFDNGSVSTDNVKIGCNVPNREGYQVILGVWDIADTNNAFYQVIDANMTSACIGEGPCNGNGNDNKDKQFITGASLSQSQTDNGDNVSYSLEVKSNTSPSSRPEYKWIFPQNAKDTSYSGNFSHFTMKKQDNVQEEIVIVNVIAGRESKILKQDIHVPGLTQVQEYDYVFPDNVASYTAGTIVLQPKDNRLYQCRPYPNSSYCHQWSASANQYEPGVGFAWEMAWILLN